MPEKSSIQRAKSAKAKGNTRVVKRSELGGVRGKSAHALKKSRGVVGAVQFEDRTVSPRRSTGEGRTTRSEKLPKPEGGSATSRRKTLPVEAAAAYRKDAPKRSSGVAKSGAGARQKTKEMKTSPVQGRKKAPSRMNVKSKGGPRKRMPLHGG